MSSDQLYIQRCYQLARMGAGHVSPNPMVGALLVYRGQIISEAYHQKFGGLHAEALVLADIRKRYGSKATDIFSESTLYVSLEPCSHMGKTPPCADAIIASGIRRVVVGSGDPSTKVDGKGLQKLKEAGVRVDAFIEELEGIWLNRRFHIQQKLQRPYIILKWAQTADGFMAPLDGSQKWISGPEAKILSHKWRTEEDAILVGTRTALIDNPQLTAREWPGRPPIRVLIDQKLEVPRTHHLMDPSAPTIVFNADLYDLQGSIRYIALPEYNYYLPQQIAYQLYLLDVQSLIIEGGAATLNLFAEAGLWDEMRVIQSPIFWKEGIKGPVVPSTTYAEQRVGNELLKTYFHPRVLELQNIK
jgi:diaminohydroxyphosphoribosylaminopyrimidine deaminase/5-amino-6-(5-phosphoribosylamino)uracil reductase